MKIYLAGPMRGYDRNNFPAFDRAAAFLRGCGYLRFSIQQNGTAKHMGQRLSLET